MTITHMVSDPDEWEAAAEFTAGVLLDHIEEWLSNAEAQPETIALILYHVAQQVPERALRYYDDE